MLKRSRMFAPLRRFRMTKLANPLVWIDLEMTGLDLSKDRIIEIAVLLTDGSLSTVIPGPNVTIRQDAALMAGMNEWCTKQHGESGLTAAVLASTTTTADAESQVLEFVRSHVPDARTAVLAGNSVHVDRQFLAKEMPTFLDHLHYRIVDVSSVKELARRWYPDAFAAAPPKPLSHRALDDIKASIEELKFYRSSIFK